MSLVARSLYRVEPMINRGPNVNNNDLDSPGVADRERLRLGAVSYLNTKPLIYDFRHLLPRAELVLDLPSRLADRLSSGDLDVALIPSVEFLRSESSSIVSDACIACRGPVRSVQLLFRCPPEEVRSLALDEGSRTSAALAQVLLAERYGIRPKISPLSMQSDFRKNTCDAAVVIGDRAMDIDSSEYVTTWDLGQEWNQTTGLPFVFAMWIRREPPSSRLHFERADVRRALDSKTPERLGRQHAVNGIAANEPVSKATNDPAIIHASVALQACRDRGLEHAKQLAMQYAPQYGLSVADCYRYFTEQLHFYLGSRELAGLELFRDRAMRLGLLPESCQQLSLQPL